MYHPNAAKWQHVQPRQPDKSATPLYPPTLLPLTSSSPLSPVEAHDAGDWKVEEKKNDSDALPIIDGSSSSNSSPQPLSISPPVSLSPISTSPPASSPPPVHDTNVQLSPIAEQSAQESDADATLPLPALSTLAPTTPALSRASSPSPGPVDATVALRGAVGSAINITPSLSRHPSASGSLLPVEDSRADTPTSSRKKHKKRDSNASNVTIPSPIEKENKVNYNYQLYSLRNKLARAEELVEEKEISISSIEKESKAYQDAYTREARLRTDLEKLYAKEKNECNEWKTKYLAENEARKLEEKKRKEADDLLLASQQDFNNKSLEFSNKIMELEAHILNEKANGNRLQKELKESMDERDKLDALKSEYYTSYQRELSNVEQLTKHAQQYEIFIGGLKSKLAETEQLYLRMYQWKLKAQEYAESWENERRRMKRRIGKLNEIVEELRRDLSDYKYILKRITVKCYVSQFLLRRALTQLFHKVCALTTESLIEQVSCIPGKQNSVQLTPATELSIRTAKLLHSNPWNRRGATLITCIHTIDNEVATLNEASKIISSQKRQWQERCDAFFQRNIELTNESMIAFTTIQRLKEQMEYKEQDFQQQLQAAQQQLQEQEQMQTDYLQLQSNYTELEQASQAAQHQLAHASAHKQAENVTLSRRNQTLQRQVKELTVQRDRIRKEVDGYIQSKEHIHRLLALERREEQQQLQLVQMQQSGFSNTPISSGLSPRPGTANSEFSWTSARTYSPHMQQYTQQQQTQQWPTDSGSESEHKQSQSQSQQNQCDHPPLPFITRSAGTPHTRTPSAPTTSNTPGPAPSAYLPHQTHALPVRLPRPLTSDAYTTRAPRTHANLPQRLVQVYGGNERKSNSARPRVRHPPPRAVNNNANEAGYPPSPAAPAYTQPPQAWAPTQQPHSQTQQQPLQHTKPVDEQKESPPTSPPPPPPHSQAPLTPPHATLLTHPQTTSSSYDRPSTSPPASIPNARSPSQHKKSPPYKVNSIGKPVYKPAPPVIPLQNMMRKVNVESTEM